MQYPDRQECIIFPFSMLADFSNNPETVRKRGRPETYTDSNNDFIRVDWAP